VIDMLMGGLGWPDGGWPEPMWRAVLGDKRFKEAKAKYLASLGATKTKLLKKPAKAAAGESELNRLRAELGEKIKHPPTDDELYSHLMYPAVFADFAKHQREYGDVSVLPTSAFFYGLQPGEEITVEIEEGKVLIIRLIGVSAPDKDGRRTVNYELNGITREAFVVDKGTTPKTKARAKADLADVLHAPAPIPGLIVVMSASVGAKVAKGDKLFMMEAMKMQTTVYALADGIIAEVHAAVGDTVETKDLIVKLRPAS
jgi:pyruvate carboxylase